MHTPFIFQKAQWVGDPAFAPYLPFNFPVADGTPRPEHPEALKNHLWYARAVIHLAAPPKSAILFLTGDDHIRFYLDDQLVVEGPTPAYPSAHPVMTVDLTTLLTQGTHVLAAEIYYQGLVNRVWNSGDFRQGFAAELVVDGQVLAPTPGPWKVHRSRHLSGAPTGYLTQFTETQDSRLGPGAWRARAFDDRDWNGAKCLPDRRHQFIPMAIPPVEHTYPAIPTPKTCVDGRRVYDFGVEMAGRVLLNARGSAGAEIEITYGEELTEAGIPRLPMRCGIEGRDRLICRGDAPSLFEGVDYKAFRYLSVKPDPAVSDWDLQIEERHQGEGGAARFESKGPLKPIWDICHRAIAVASQGVLMDCPTREKGQYLGDLTVSGHGRLYASGDSSLWKKALFDFAQSALVCPGLLAVAPGSFFQDIADFSLQYPWQVLTYFRHTGDRATLQALVPVARGMLQYFKGFDRGDGLLADVKPKWNLVDWPANLRDGYDFALEPGAPGPGAHAALNGHYLAAVNHLATLEGFLGEAPTYSPSGISALRASFQKAFWKADRGLMVDHPTSTHASLHGNALALWAGAIPPHSIPTVHQFIMEKGLSCGVQMAYFVMKALSQTGAPQLAYQLMTQDSEHSWAQMLRDGATCALEAWGLDQKWNTSMCHPWAAAPIPVFVEDTAGLRPLSPGWAQVGFAPDTRSPVPDYRLHLTLPVGPMETWKDDQTWGLKIGPCATATVVIPAGVQRVGGDGLSTRHDLAAGETATWVFRPL